MRKLLLAGITGRKMTTTERKERLVTLILEQDEEARSTIIDELSEADVKEMLKMMFVTIHSERAVKM